MVPEKIEHQEDDRSEKVTPWSGLKRRAVRGGIWIVVGRLTRQALRLISSLVLTRLLYPEAMGLMVYVQIFVQGARLFSDIGIRGSIVHDPSGEEEKFLNTAWTVQIIRGVAMWIVVVVLAWPAAWIYEEPELRLLVPVVGITLFINGFDCTARHSLVRRVKPGKDVFLTLGAHVAALSTMIVLAAVTGSVWALVAGELVRSTTIMVVSHLMVPGYRNRIALDRESVAAIFHFGKWVFISTGIMFLLSQGDRIVLGKMVTAAELGIYGVASVLSRAVVRTIQGLSQNLLVPVYARVAEHGTEELRKRTYRIRLTLIALALPVVWIFAIWGQNVVELLYDERYHDAGWMVQILAVGHVGTVISMTADPVFLARGDSFRQMVWQAARAIVLIAGMAIGGVLGGVPGLLAGIAAARIVDYGILVLLIRKYQVWLPALDFAAFLVSGIVITMGHWLS